MNAKDLNAAMQYIDDHYLDIADAPQKEIMKMSKRKTAARMILIAAVVAMLAITAYAADFMNVRSLYSGTKISFSVFPEMEKAMEEAGFRMDAKESFRSGYTFQTVNVQEVQGSDENGKEVLTYSSIAVMYRNEAGTRLMLTAEPVMAELPDTDQPVAQSREIGAVTAEYIINHYKFVPEDYEPTDADKAWMEQPGNFLSYGSDEIEETEVAFLHWTKNGIRYDILDPRGAEQPDVLFSMAEELILAK